MERKKKKSILKISIHTPFLSAQKTVKKSSYLSVTITTYNVQPWTTTSLVAKDIYHANSIILHMHVINVTFSYME